MFNVDPSKSTRYVLFFNTDFTNQAQPNVTGAVVYDRNPFTKTTEDPTPKRILLKLEDQLIDTTDIRDILPSMLNLLNQCSREYATNWVTHSHSDDDYLYKFYDISNSTVFAGTTLPCPEFAQRFRVNIIKSVQSAHKQTIKGHKHNRKVELKLGHRTTPAHWMGFPKIIPQLEIHTTRKTSVGSKLKAAETRTGQRVTEQQNASQFDDMYNIVALTEKENSLTKQKSDMVKILNQLIAEHQKAVTSHVNDVKNHIAQMQLADSYKFDSFYSTDLTVTGLHFEGMSEKANNLITRQLSRLNTISRQIRHAYVEFVSISGEISNVQAQIQLLSSPAAQIGILEQTLMSKLPESHLKVLKDYRKLLKQYYSRDDVKDQKV